jgi:Apea-like HEPN
MAKVTYITRVYGLKVTSNLGGGERFHNDLLVANDRSIAGELLTTETKRVIGHLESEALRSADTIVYGRFPVPTNFDDPAGRVAFLNEQLVKTRGLLNALWLVKDNCANTEQGFLVGPGRFGEDITSNAMSLLFTTIEGETHRVTEFTREELGRARAFVTQMFEGPAVAVKEVMHQRVHEAFRFTRALYFVEAARVTSDLAMKISNYCTAFECLFAFETGELTHRLGERLARFIGSDASTRREIYLAVKQAYEIRSKTVHGARSNAKYEKVLPIARSCDDLLRRAMRKISESKELHPLFLAPEPDPRAFSNYLLDLVLG